MTPDDFSLVLAVIIVLFVTVVASVLVLTL